jgi:hypothetical protein
VSGGGSGSRQQKLHVFGVDGSSLDTSHSAAVAVEGEQQHHICRNHVDAMDTIGVYDGEQYRQFLHQAVSVAKIDFEAHGCEHHVFKRFAVPNLKCKKSWHQ